MKKLIIILAVLIGVFAGFLVYISKDGNLTEPEVIKPYENENPVATIEIEGYEPMVFVLEPNTANQTVLNFISLANSGFYDGLTMHRLIKDFMIQGGDPDGTGAGGPGYAIKGEFKSNGYNNPIEQEKGVIAMARSQAPDSAGSQFYIVTGPNALEISEDYAAFGQLLVGEETLDKLNNLPTEGEKPAETIKIKKISVDTKGVTYPEPEKLEDPSAN
ncbi:MAG: peptidylprolyl isomerase [Mycoplasmatales bacterium]